jgi:hypothetical protein
MDRRGALRAMMALAAMFGLPATAVFGQDGRSNLLMFDDPGCPYCRQWHREVGEAYRNSPEGQRAPLQVVQLRGPRPEGINLATPVRATPTFVLVHDGREIGRIIGYGGADFFWSSLEPLMRKLEAAKQI